MDLSKALADLREQRDHIDQAIQSLERLANSRPRGRGRPPGRKSDTDKKEAPPAGGSGNRAKASSE